MTPENEDAPAPNNPNIETVPFHYIKSSQFRVVHADGALGGTTVRGYLALSFFNERRPIPRKTELRVNEAEKSAREILVDGREGAVREVEVCVMLDERTTSELVVWLQGKLKELQTQREGDPKEGNGDK